MERINQSVPTWNLLGFFGDSIEFTGKEVGCYIVLGTIETVVNYLDALLYMH